MRPLFWPLISSREVELGSRKKILTRVEVVRFKCAVNWQSLERKNEKRETEEVEMEKEEAEERREREERRGEEKRRKRKLQFFSATVT